MDQGNILPQALCSLYFCQALLRSRIVNMVQVLLLCHCLFHYTHVRSCLAVHLCCPPLQETLPQNPSFLIVNYVLEDKRPASESETNCSCCHGNYRAHMRIPDATMLAYMYESFNLFWLCNQLVTTILLSSKKLG